MEWWWKRRGSYAEDRDVWIWPPGSATAFRGMISPRFNPCHRFPRILSAKHRVRSIAIASAKRQRRQSGGEQGTASCALYTCDKQ